MEAWIEYIETTGRVHLDFSRNVERNGHGVTYIKETDGKGNGKHIFRTYSRIVSISSTDPIPHEREGQSKEWTMKQRH